MEGKKNTINVEVRIKPSSQNSIEIQGNTLSLGTKTYSFSRIHLTTTQNQLYKCSVSSLVDNFVEGYNCTVLAYGQTGSGKTYTMGISDTDVSGIVPQALNDLFKRNIEMTCTFIEIYNEDVIDLLSDHKIPLAVREVRGDVVVAGATEVEIKSLEDGLNILKKGCLERTTKSTKMNLQSSRSHAIFTLFLRREICGSFITSKFSFVDLAGSERLKRTMCVGQRARESISINSGLLALGNVISALYRKAKHIPYRDSKLTRILQSCLNGHVFMIACVSSAHYDMNETHNTLKYANRAACIQTTVKMNVEVDGSKMAVLMLKKEIQKLKSENQILRERIRKSSHTQIEELIKENRHLKSQLENVQYKKDLDDNAEDLPQKVLKHPFVQNLIEENQRLSSELATFKTGSVHPIPMDVEETRIAKDLMSLDLDNSNIENMGSKDFQKIKTCEMENVINNKSLEKVPSQETIVNNRPFVFFKSNKTNELAEEKTECVNVTLKTRNNQPNMKKDDLKSLSDIKNTNITSDFKGEIKTEQPILKKNMKEVRKEKRFSYRDLPNEKEINLQYINELVKPKESIMKFTQEKSKNTSSQNLDESNNQKVKTVLNLKDKKASIQSTEDSLSHEKRTVAFHSKNGINDEVGFKNSNRSTKPIYSENFTKQQGLKSHNGNKEDEMMGCAFDSENGFLKPSIDKPCLEAIQNISTQKNEILSEYMEADVYDVDDVSKNVLPQNNTLNPCINNGNQTETSLFFGSSNHSGNVEDLATSNINNIGGALCYSKVIRKDDKNQNSRDASLFFMSDTSTHESKSGSSTFESTIGQNSDEVRQNTNYNKNIGKNLVFKEEIDNRPNKKLVTFDLEEKPIKRYVLFTPRKEKIHVECSIINKVSGYLPFCMSKLDNKLVFSSIDNRVRIWDEKVVELFNDTGVRCLESDDKLLYYTTKIMVKQYDSRCGSKPLCVFKSEASALKKIDNLLYIGHEDGTLSVLDLLTMKYHSEKVHAGTIFSIEKVGQNLYTSSRDHNVKCINNGIVSLSPPHYDAVHVLLGYHNQLISLGRDCSLKRWDNTKIVKTVPYAHDSWIRSGVVLKNCFVTGSKNGTLRFWDFCNDSIFCVGKTKVNGSVNCMYGNDDHFYVGTQGKEILYMSSKYIK